MHWIHELSSMVSLYKGWKCTSWQSQHWDYFSYLIFRNLPDMKGSQYYSRSTQNIIPEIIANIDRRDEIFLINNKSIAIEEQ